jgi:uncharacterized lipoprotein YajG
MRKALVLIVFILLLGGCATSARKQQTQPPQTVTYEKPRDHINRALIRRGITIMKKMRDHTTVMKNRQRRLILSLQCS